MTLDKDGVPTGLNKRAWRVARGSGTSVREVEELLTQGRAMSGMAKMASGMANAGKGGQASWYVANPADASRKIVSADSWYLTHRMKAAQQMQASGTRPTAAQIQAMQVRIAS